MSEVVDAGGDSEVGRGVALGVSLRRIVWALGGFTFVFVTVWLGALSLFVAEMACDDTCEVRHGTPPPGTDWTTWSDAPQWTVMGWLAASNVVLALTAVALALARHRRAALLLVAVYSAVSVVLTTLQMTARPSWLWWLWGGIGVVALIVALRSGDHRSHLTDAAA